MLLFSVNPQNNGLIFWTNITDAEGEFVKNGPLFFVLLLLITLEVVSSANVSFVRVEESDDVRNQCLSSRDSRWNAICFGVVIGVDSVDNMAAFKMPSTTLGTRTADGSIVELQAVDLN